MTELVLWLLVAVMTPACYQSKQIEYKECLAARAAQDKTPGPKLYGYACVPPTEFQGVSLSLGKPALSNGSQLPDDCLEVRAVKISTGKTKAIPLKEWNQKAEKDAKPVAAVKK